MARHRNIRNTNYDDYDEYEEFGRSYEDDSSVSPSMAQFIYHRNNSGKELDHPSTVLEEEELQDEESLEPGTDTSNAKSVDQGRLLACSEYIENCSGEAFSREQVRRAVIAAGYNAERALQLLLDHQGDVPVDDAMKSVSSSKPPLPLLTKKLENLTVKDRPTELGLPRVGSTPDFRNLSQDRSTASTPTLGSPKSFRRNSSKAQTPVGHSPAVTPVPGSPRALRKTPKEKASAQKLPGKGDDVGVDAMVAVSVPEVPVSRSSAKVASIYEERQSSTKPLINLIVIGHVDAGKSTLMGHFLHLIGKVDAKQMAKFEHEAKKIGKSSFMYAWVLDETGEERSRGVTIDVAQTSFETANRFVNLMDAPGHKDFIPNMITGAAQADVALLVVDATRGEFETGFETGGQTREHTLLARSLGVTQLTVVVNKMDTVDWSQERFDHISSTLAKFLKATGFKDGDVSFVPCSGFTGDNLVKPPTNAQLASWWTGMTLLDRIITDVFSDSFRPPVRQIDRPYRQVITDVFKSAAGGVCISGRLEAGHIQVGDRIVVMPAAASCVVKGIVLESGSCNNAFAGDYATLTLSGMDVLNLHVGDVLCDPVFPVISATRLRGRIALFVPKVPLIAGQECVFHNQSYTESCVIKKLNSQINRNTGEVLKKNPRALTKNTSGEVEIVLQRPVCAELFSVSKELGRFMLRDSGSTIAAGVIVEILG